MVLPVDKPGGRPLPPFVEPQPVCEPVGMPDNPSAVESSVGRVTHTSVIENASLVPGLALARAGAALARAGEMRAIGRPARRHQPGDIYFLGDSQTEGLRVFGGLGAAEGRGRDGDDHATVNDNRGKTTKFFLQRLRSGELDATLADEELVVLNFGGNDITGTRWSAAKIQNYIRGIVRELKRINPDVRVVISDIPVRGRWMDAHPQHKATRETVLNAVNAWLRAGGEGDARFESFPANDFIALRDAQGRPTRLQRPEYRRSGADVHLNRAGYARLAAALRERFFVQQ